jgi:hypothetical protein
VLFATVAAAFGCAAAAPAVPDGFNAVASPAFRLSADAAAAPASAHRLADEDWTGGLWTLPAGERVIVYVSTAYSGDDAAGRRWADYLGGLVHGAELNLLEAYVAPPEDVRELCSAEALGCYGNNTMISIGEPVQGVSPEEVVAHEYGHHVAHNRANPPWRAIDYGTKRWATHARICARAGAAEVFPGDEGHRYALNPGEGFAEAYRALVESKRGARAFAWTLVDRSFYPDAEALARVEEDVLRPWSQPKPTKKRARVRAGTRSWTMTVASPLDGSIEVSVKLAAGTGATLDVLDGRVAARGLWASTTEQRASFRVCGSRRVRVRVTARAGTRFLLAVSLP